MGPILELLLHGIARLIKQTLRLFGKAAIEIRRLSYFVDAVFLAISASAGWFWGNHVANANESLPIVVWSLLGAAGVGIVFGAASQPSDTSEVDEPHVVPATRWWSRWLQFDRARWFRFAGLNLAGAAGIVVGYLG